MKNTTIIILVVILLGGGLFAFNKYYSPKQDVSPEGSVNINADKAIDSASPEAAKTETSPTVAVRYTLTEVEAHNNKNDCWIAINGKVYNATEFIASGMHNDKILNGCGKDASSMFAQIPKHASAAAQAQLEKQFIGNLN